MKTKNILLLLLLLLFSFSKVNADTTTNGFQVDSYKVDNNKKIIYQINNGTFVKTLIDNTYHKNTEDYGTREVVNAKEVAKSGTDRLITGYKMKLTYNNTTYEYKLSILGDVIGNGKISVDGAKKVTKHIVNNNIITEDTYLLAADINSDGKIKMDDVMRMLKNTTDYVSQEDMKNSYNLLVKKQDTKIYAYAPSIMVDGNNTYIWYCSNRYNDKVYDYAYFTNDFGQNRTIALSPGIDSYQTNGSYPAINSNQTYSFDYYHICDPSVVKGNFNYNGSKYSYIMAYLGDDDGEVQENDIGLAVSNSPNSGWIKVNTSPVVSHESKVTGETYSYTAWGVGQPSLIYVDNKLIMFYTDAGYTHYEMRAVIINPNTLTVESTANLSSTNTTWMHNADFAIKDNRLYVIYEGPESSDDLRINYSGSNGDYISNTVIIKSAAITNYTNINEYKNLIWEDENIISSSISGKARNTNGGLFRTPTGELASRKAAFTAVDTALCPPNSGRTYCGFFDDQIYETIF